ncbi:MAG: MFS transporter [Synechococcus sp. SB0668_bin_15]|nr:MFS transporter [Synechococcus sp. SB0668_bin_15]MXZ82151.1 MFS transporter [Synechococcus sp. SB0666_bin_14]MYA90318.1 MFS transporter [Synechococcus sp. SB0663_bin_10]MYC50105.1 MFS transporter [Synechococcus sp. SB0662_bin_14]MYG47677.1 MFS transporter [Synechococcus sp. SB0675_bin_6]MYJ60238.1 MFS transporter [Synechococcus sp. SB0672_bin_6]MYK92032.1 MFS transporter [Synechococcus sp. SB0669_bin_8]
MLTSPVARVPSSRSFCWLQRYPPALVWSCLLRGLALMGLTGIGFYLGIAYGDRLSGLALGYGFAVAAAVGIVSRWLAGRSLDGGLHWRHLLAVSGLLAAASMVQLRDVGDWPALLLGMALQGLGLGLFWPAAEIAVAQTHGPIPLGKAFTLARFCEAVGSALGVLGTAVFTVLGRASWAFLAAAAVLLALAVAALLSPGPVGRQPVFNGQAQPQQRQGGYRDLAKVPGLPAVLLISITATSIIILQQSALPLDLVRGSLGRPALAPVVGNLVVAVQLVLLVVMQLPVGRLASRWPTGTSLRWSLLAFAGGQALMALSSVPMAPDLLLVVGAQVLTAVGTAAFLPTASTACLERTPAALQGRAMAAYSECWGISSVVAPPVAGWLLEMQGHGVSLWLLLTALCLAASRLNPDQYSNSVGKIRP